MPENTRVKISSVVKNQLPDFIRADFPLAGEFLAQYYTAIENQGSTLDVLQNLDKYVKIDELTDLIDSTNLSSNVGIADNSISVESTTGFPDSYGLIQINNEIVTYTGITTNSFTGCSRGFSGITSYRSPNKPDELLFSQSGISTHSSGSVVNNLSIRFLQEFFKKVKKQVTPGFEERALSSDIDERLFIKQSKDFYSSKGTDQSFEILFRALYGKDVEILKPRDFLFIPSESNYKISQQIIVEPIDGDPRKLVNRNLFQDAVDGFQGVTASVSAVEPVVRGDNTYYMLSLDYDKVSERVSGEFPIHPNTKLIDNVSIGGTVLTVDSTVGFSTTGSLIANFDDGTSSTIKYESKSLTQFFGCSGVTRSIDSTQDLKMNAYAYGYSGVGTASVVKLRVTGVLKDLDLNLNTATYNEIGDVIEPRGLGSKPDDIVSKSLFYNISTTYDVESIKLIDQSNFTYQLNLFDDHSFIVGDSALINSIQCSIISLISSKEVLIKGAGELSLSTSYRIQRLLSKANLSNYPNTSIYTTNIQNSYVDDDECVYITSSSLPDYFNEDLDIRDTVLYFSGNFSNNTDITIPNHGLLTGEKVKYISGGEDNELDILEQEYFIKKVDINTIKLARSLSNVSSETYVAFTGSVVDNRLELAIFANKSILSQNLIRKIQPPVSSPIAYPTPTGKTGILINGVEILNYKSNDQVHYGSVQNISVTAEGSGYDVVNPPLVTITDPVGSGVSAFCEVQGSLERIDVVDGGFDYITTPTLKVSGGNGIGCVVYPNLVLKDHSPEFNSTEDGELVNLTNNTIGFSTFHKFADGELVTYNPEGQTAIAGLTTDAAYYCCVKSATTVTLHKEYDNAVDGLSAIDLTDYGTGLHKLECANQKRVISSVSIASSGIGYRNRLTSITSAGINTATNTINIVNHGYRTGEKLRYDTKSINPISGLTTQTDYYVSDVDGNSFRLSAVGVGSTAATQYLRNKEYVNLLTGGTGDHEFNYPPITVTVDGNIGVSTFTGQNFQAQLRPIVKGSIESVYVPHGGSTYGSADIINYNRQPDITLKTGKNAELLPLVDNNSGKVTDVLVLNGGSEYNSAPELSMVGDGNGTVLIPILQAGSVESVKVVHSGIGYTSFNSSIKVTSNGQGAKFYSNIKTWTINNVQRLIQNDQITSDDGIVSNGFSDQYQLEYSHAYAPRKLRQSTYVKKSVGDKEIFTPDLTLNINAQEETSGDHSPIIGWAYDGSPIYGPYGYRTNSGGPIKILESGYSVSISSERPNPITVAGEQVYSDGFFVEDYSYQADRDLDEHNGRFCKTPEYPNGVYAYFATINPTTFDSEGSFKNFNRPVFPYFIGNSYKSELIEYNFNYLSNQNEINLNNTNLVRNTNVYNFLFSKSTYDFLVNPNFIRQQKTFVTQTSTGVVEEVGIKTGGSNYKVNDIVVFNDDGTSGYGAEASVHCIGGKTISNVSIANTNFSNVEFIVSNKVGEFIGYTTLPHNFNTKDFVTISGLSTGVLANNISKPIGIRTSRFKLNVGISSAGATGLTTYFNIDGQFDKLNILPNDVLGIGTECVKVLNVEKHLGRIRVLRNHQSTIGSAHTATSLIEEKPRDFKFSAITPNTLDLRLNREFYFNPSDSVALGNASGVGIGTTISFSNPGTGISEIYIPTKSIFIKDHKLEMGDTLTYKVNDGTALGVSTDGTMEFTLAQGQTLFAAPISKDLIGIATIRVGLGATGSFEGISETTKDKSTLYFTGFGTGLYHSFETNYTNVLSGAIKRSLATVSTSSTHGLLANDAVEVTALPGISTTINVAYNDYNRRLVINPRTFVSGDVNTTNSTITIPRHEYITGQKVIGITTSGGLAENQIYYVFVVDEDTIKLSNQYEESLRSYPKVINITSAHAGTISPINPQLNLERNQQIEFNLSDSSLSFFNDAADDVQYSAFAFVLYTDKNMNDIFYSSGQSDDFNVSSSGRVGVDANAKLTIKNINEITQSLYYNLVPVNDLSNKKVKKEIIRDTLNITNSNGSVLFKNSLNGIKSIVSAGSTTFDIAIPSAPKKLQYSNDDGEFSYKTYSNTAKGPIEDVKILSSGREYRTLPGISTIVSKLGKDAILEPRSSSIGRIANIDIQDIGFDYPADKTLKPEAQIPQLIKVDSFSSIDNIGITSAGNNYLDAPGLVVLDGSTNKVVSDIDLTYQLGDENVTVLKNTRVLNKVEPTILPTGNSNGVNIASADYNESNQRATISIGVSYSTLDDYPFEVGKKVMIEGVSVGVGSTGSGYNSANYEYKLFEILATDPNVGGTLGSITYSLAGVIPSGKIPGTYNSASIGRVIREEDFPLFRTTLKGNQFDVGETLESNTAVGVLQSFNMLNGYLKVSSASDFKVGDEVVGEASGTKATVTEHISYKSLYDIQSSSIVKEGWKNNFGFLNDNEQRLFDSDYYQYFSYSIKSEVEIAKWKDAVSSLNHTSGFKKFSDLVLKNDVSAGLSTTQDGSSFDVITALVKPISLNTVFDFDLAREKNEEIDGKIISDEIVFTSRDLKDYTESVGNRVLSIDDISPTFNDNARTDPFMAVDTFALSGSRDRKSIVYIRDKRFTGERQVMVVNALHDELGNFFLNQYGSVWTENELGSFDMTQSGDNGQLLFYPKKFDYNNYDVSVIAYNVGDSTSGIGSTNFGGMVNVGSDMHLIEAGISTSATVVGIASTYRSSKILVSYASSDSSYYETEELTLIHNGSDVELLEYGQLNTDELGSPSGTPGLGTYSAYYSGSHVYVDLHPTVSTASTYIASTIQVSIGNSLSAGVGTDALNTGTLDSRYTAISSSGSPGITTVAKYETETFAAAYYIVSVEDVSNSQYQVSEILVVDNGTTGNLTEYGIVQTGGNLGDFSININGAYTHLGFKPLASADVQVRVFQNALRLVDDSNANNEIGFTNASVDTGAGAYTATETDVKRSFELTHKEKPIFKRDFVGGASTVVSTITDSVIIPNHFFVTGEELEYRYTGTGTTSAIEITSQSIPGVGVTDKLPSTVFAVKKDDKRLQLATSAENALKTNPTFIDITAVGVGTSHSFTSKKQNSRCIISIDNIVQQPIVATAVTTHLVADVSTTSDTITISGITSITGGDMLKIGNEIMKVDSVGLGVTNKLLVTRPWMGTGVSNYSSGDLVTKIEGNYNIVDNKVNFFTAPVGLIPLSSTTNEPSSRDWVGVATHSTFNGRSFMRSGITGSAVEPYTNNYIFDDISHGFSGFSTEFTLESDGSNVAGFSTSNAIVLINQVAQGPQRFTGLESKRVSVSGDYTLRESVGITSIQFTGTIASVSYDPNTANVPLGGVVVSVGSTEGFGYQPLVSAGGTAVVSGLGTITSISIGNSGSGYRAGIQTVVNVGVQTASTGAPAIEFIGTAAISGGNIVSIAITNPGTGYTTTNPPSVVIDEPLSYSNMPLFYTSTSSGVGSEAKANIIVGQGSSVIDFEIINEGYGYGQDQVLTIGVGGAVGIPTDSNFSPSRQFEVTVREVGSDSFAAWSIGDLEVLDPLDDLFDGQDISFPLKLNGAQQTIQSKPGSNVDVEYTILVFINDILQVPGNGYEFKGGSYLTFKEAPKKGDTSKILFYKGTASVDTATVDILETVQTGDELKLHDQDISFEEGLRTVTSINAADNVNTNPYPGPGITTNETFDRPINWFKQTEDKVIDGQSITKDRSHYEPSIYPTTTLIQPVGVASTEAYVENIRIFFDSTKENYGSQDSINIISQEDASGAAGTALVSAAGSITSIAISDVGIGYTFTPTVSIEQPVGLGTTQVATATATLNGDSLGSITITNIGSGYTVSSPPAVLIEEPKMANRVEKATSITYTGDYGTIVGFGTTTAGSQNKFVFDLYIPEDSYLRDATYVGTAITLSTLKVGDFFLVDESNVGTASTILRSFNVGGATTIGVGTQFVDNVYQVSDVNTVSVANTAIGISTVGTATTYVTRVFVNIDLFTTDSFDSSILKFDSTNTKFDSNGIGATFTGNVHNAPFYGTYSWGYLELGSRTQARDFNFYGQDGLGGISTSGFIQRFNPLRDKEYL